MIHFDHIEVHVKNPKLYSNFLKKLFKGGRSKKISIKEKYMFLSNYLLRQQILSNLMMLMIIQVIVRLKTYLAKVLMRLEIK